MAYHIARNNQQLGQFEPGDVQQKLASGELLATDLCWTEGMAEWQPLGQVIAPAGVVSQAAPPPANPYAPPTVENWQAPKPAGGAALASLGQRLGAAILDGVVAMVVAVPMVMATAMAGVDETGELGEPNMAMLAVAGILFLVLLVLNVMWLITRGQTIGKRIVGIRIADLHSDVNPGGVKTVLLRGIVNGMISSIPILGGIYALVDICFIFGEERRCIHDLIAGTRVIQGQP